MKKNPQKIQKLIASIDELIERLDTYELKYAHLLKRVHPDMKPSALNLVHYRALRSVDIRSLQEKLGKLGISRLAQSQAHVMAGLIAGKAILLSLLGTPPNRERRPPVSVKRGSKLLRSHTKTLFGHRSSGRRTRIMVTLPTSAAHDYDFVQRLVQAGMNSARINCAHDDPAIWHAMIENVDRARRSARRDVSICMDLSGPKIRTGPMVPGPGVVVFQPDRDNLGRVSGPGLVWLAPPGKNSDADGYPHLPVNADWLADVNPGDEVVFRDTRNKERFVRVVEKQAHGCWAHAFDRSFVVSGTRLFVNELGRRPSEVLDIPPDEEVIVLNVGDRLILHRANRLGEPVRRDEKGRILSVAHVSCTNSDVFDQIVVGERVVFDDGKIEGTIIALEPGEQALIEVTRAKSQGQKLRGDKGINFPDTSLSNLGLTKKDRDDLAFIVEHADVVNMSFVNRREDVEELLRELERLNALHKIGLMLKIETQRAFDDLTEILLTAMQTVPIGVMIARGDLAVECGWRNIPRIQQEIQSFCRAAHVPDVWATQVLENLAKKGLPTRAELTDVASANWAECVMLNKGPYVDRAIAMLDSILRDMRPYVHDKAPMFPSLPEEHERAGERPATDLESREILT